MDQGAWRSLAERLAQENADPILAVIEYLLWAQKDQITDSNSWESLVVVLSPPTPSLKMIWITVFAAPLDSPTSPLTFAGRGLIILCLPWQRHELVQLEEHNELDASNCACMGVSWESSAPDSVELRHTRLSWLVQAVHFWLVWATKLKCAFCATGPQIWHAVEISLSFLSR